MDSCGCALQVEVQGSGYAQSRIGYEAFRLHYYKTNELKWGRLVVELLFVLLSALSFATDLSPVIFRRYSVVKQDGHWSRCELPAILFSFFVKLDSGRCVFVHGACAPVVLPS
jgi:hypothetical protein